MNFAVIGSGGREHALCYKLKQSPKIGNIICIPGNAGTNKIAENIKEDILNFSAVYKIIKKKDIDIVIIGPEQPLVQGLSDYLFERNIRVFGPDKFSSQLEGSKAFMKNLCKKIIFLQLVFMFWIILKMLLILLKKAQFQLLLKLMV